MVELFVTLTTERKAELMDEAAGHDAKLEALEAKKDAFTKKINGEIKEEEEHIRRILRVVRNRGENQDQRDLKFDGDSRVTEDAAKAALAALHARQPECTPIKARSCPRHGKCSCEPMMVKCPTCGATQALTDALSATPADEVAVCQECPDKPKLENVEPEGDAPAVAATDCVLHGVNAPHSTEPPAVEPELTEPQIIEKMAREAVEEWARLGKTPDSVKERNARVKEAVAAQSIAIHRRKPFAEAVKRLLSDQPSIPAGAGASDAPAEEPGDDVGNVAEAEA